MRTLLRPSLKRPESRSPGVKKQIVFACFLATFIAYVERVGFSIAFTAISQKADINKAALGGVLSAFYWGYGLSQVGSASPAAAFSPPGGSLFLPWHGSHAESPEV